MPLTLPNGKKGFLVGRGGGHTPPEKPLGVSLVDAADGSEIWKLPIDNYECRQTMPIHNGHALVMHDERALVGGYRIRQGYQQGVALGKRQDSGKEGQWLGFQID